MKRLAIVLLAILSAAPAFAASECRYVSKENPLAWIKDNGASLTVSDPKGSGLNVVYDVADVFGRPGLRKATWANTGGTELSFLYRILDFKSQRVLIADMDVYLRQCGTFKLPPA
jgi:hypothetical protein